MNSKINSSDPALTASALVTKELLNDVQPLFVKMLTHQNTNHENRIARILKLERNQQITIMIWLSSAISFLSFVLFFFGEIFSSWVWLVLGIGFAILFVISILIGPGKLDDRFHSHLKGIFRWRVRRTFTRTAKATPFNADYSFYDDRLVTKIDSLGIRKETAYCKIDIGYRSENFYCFFASKTTQFWKAIVYLDDTADFEIRNEIDKFLAEQSIEMIGLEKQASTND